MVTICAMTATIMQALDTTIWVISCASPHITDAMVKPAEQMMKMRLRPKRLAIHPTGAVMIAAATI